MANILIKQGLEIAVPDFVITTDEARKVDLTSIIQTGTTSSQAISAGTYFYLNNVLVRAKVDIASGATFTLNTNYEVVTAGALNELIDAIADINTALGYKYKLIYNSGKFTADNTVPLTDDVANFKFLVARTGNSSDGSSSRGFVILPSMVASMGCYMPYNKGDKFLRINASSTSFRLIECTSGEYIYQVYGVY